jgi:hypothetical protein
MTDDSDQGLDREILLQQENEDKFKLSIPAQDEDVRRFFNSILGGNQETAKIYRHNFSVNLSNICDLFDIINERIVSQNLGQIVNTKIKIYYEDGSSSAFNDIREFRSFRLMHDLKTYDLQLQADYLVRFASDRIPRKQSIQVLFSTGERFQADEPESEFSIINKLNRLISDGGRVNASIVFGVEHSDRSFGLDISNLISINLRKYLVFRTPIEVFLSNISTILAGLIAISALMFCMSVQTGVESAITQSEMQNALTESGIPPSDFIVKLNVNQFSEILSIVSKSGPSILGLFIMVLSFPICFGTFIAVKILCNVNINSHIIITEKDLTAANSQTHRISPFFRLAIVAFTTVLLGIISNFLYNYILQMYVN